MEEKKTDLRVLKTKQALRNSFIDLIREKTFESITVNELCDQAMVRRATFYKHYADKYDFVIDYIREQITQFHHELTEYHPDTTPADYCTKMFLRFISFIEQERIPLKAIENHLFSIIASIITEEIYADVLNYLESYTKEQTPVPVDTKILSSFYSGGIVRLATDWFMKPQTMSLDDYVAQFQKMAAIFEAGLATNHS